MVGQTGKFAAVYGLVKQISYGEVASYGMIASLLPGVTARMVGFAMAATPQGQGIPWHRVINSAGKVTERPGAERQRLLLKDEGISLTPAGKISWKAVRWQGPSEQWLDSNAVNFMDYLDIQAKWPA